MIIPFSPEHLLRLKLQPHQSLLEGELSLAYGKSLADSGKCFTCMRGDEVLACSGFVEIWEGRYLAWALITSEALNPRVFVEINAAAQRLLKLFNYRRIEAYVDIHHEKAHDWIKKLGFSLEVAEMKSFLPNGQSQALYSRVRP